MTTLDGRMSSFQCYILGCLLTAFAFTSTAASESLPSQGAAVNLLRLMSTSSDGDMGSKWRSLDADASRPNSVKGGHVNNHVDDARWTDDQIVDFDPKFDRDAETTMEEKRKWAGKGMSIWGKRGKWAKNNLQVWGKRNLDALRDQQASGNEDLDREEDDPAKDVDDQNEDKRNWAKNGMKIWGKRNEGLNNEEEEDEDAKRNWAKNGMKIWGKRGSGELFQSDDFVNGEVHHSPTDDSRNLLGSYLYSNRGQLIPERSNRALRKFSYTRLPGVWGKFGPFPSGGNNPKRISTRNGIKKGWASNNMRIWGK